jgi:hypothetical protein
MLDLLLLKDCTIPAFVTDSLLGVAKNSGSFYRTVKKEQVICIRNKLIFFSKGLTRSGQL